METGYSCFDTSKTSGLISGPLGEYFAGSLAVFYNDTGQYYEYEPDSVQQDLPREITKGVRAKLRWIPTDEFEATLGYTRISQDGINTALNSNTAPSLAASLLGADRQPRDHTARVNDDVTFLLDTEVFTGDAKWSPGGIDIKLLGGVQRHRNFGRNDFDGSNAPIITFSAPLAADVETAE